MACGARGRVDHADLSRMEAEPILEAPRVAGQHARARARALAARVLAIAALVLLAPLVGYAAFGIGGLPLVALELAAIGLIVVSDRILGSRFDRWHRGAGGEEAVGAILAGLSAQGWHVTHDFTLGRGNIDHVLVGPGGLFAVETKSHPGRYSIDRLDPKMLKQAYAEKKLLETISGAKARALLVFSGAWLIDAVPAQRRGVTVLPARQLEEFLARQRPTMSAEDAWELHVRLADAAGQAPTMID